MIRRAVRQFIKDRFHKWFYTAWNTWRVNTWAGVRIEKNPYDMHIYQEILFREKFDLIIECGTCAGGSALFMAHMCDIIGKGHIVTVDIEKRERPRHDRITYIHGSSTSAEVSNLLYAMAKSEEKVLVILDSDHTQKHVAEEMRLYAPLATTYLIVEDGNINGHPVLPDFGPGPQEAIQEFLKTNKDFEIDPTCERLMLTFNPNGYLKRIR